MISWSIGHKEMVSNHTPSIGCAKAYKHVGIGLIDPFSFERRQTVLDRKPEERRKVVKTELLHQAVARLWIGQPSGPVVACRSSTRPDNGPHGYLSAI
jgi:hypothetical protein